MEEGKRNEGEGKRKPVYRIRDRVEGEVEAGRGGVDGVVERVTKPDFFLLVFIFLFPFFSLFFCPIRTTELFPTSSH